MVNFGQKYVVFIGALHLVVACLKQRQLSRSQQEPEKDLEERQTGEDSGATSDIDGLLKVVTEWLYWILPVLQDYKVFKITSVELEVRANC